MVKTFFERVDRLTSNTYIVGKINQNCLIVDLGNNDSSIIEYVKDNYNLVEGILLTHGHYDHIQAVDSFIKEFNYNIPIYISKFDLELLNNPNLNCSAFHNKKVITNFNPILIESEKDINLRSFNIKPIFTPYHTSGSICYLLEDENALFTGDSLFKLSIGRTDLPTSDSTKLNKSISKLFKLSKYLTIYPGHGEITNLEYELRNNPYLLSIKR